MAYIHLYKNNPTQGGTDGTQVSEQTETEPVVFEFTLSGSDVTGDPYKLAIRCESGYQTKSGENTTIQPYGTNASKWRLADDNNGQPGTWQDWGASLIITSQIGSTNKIFWIQAKATADENPQNDTSVDIKTTATIEAV